MSVFMTYTLREEILVENILAEEIFAEFIFANEVGKISIFARINFREWHFRLIFAGINFRD